MRIEQPGNGVAASGIMQHGVTRDLLALFCAYPLNAAVLDEHRGGLAKTAGREIKHSHTLDEEWRRHIAHQSRAEWNLRTRPANDRQAPDLPRIRIDQRG